MGFNGVVNIVKAEDLDGQGTGDASPKYSLGAKHFKDGNSYVYVYNAAANSTIGTGKYCVLDQNGGTSFTSGYSVTVTNASLAGVLVGVAQNTISTGYYGWVMYNGVSLASTDGGQVSANAGVDLALGTDGGFVAAGATFATAPRFAFTLNSFVTGATSKVRLHSSVIS